MNLCNPRQSAGKRIHMYEPSQEWHDFTFDWLIKWRKKFLIYHKALYGAVPVATGLKSRYSFAILVTPIDYVQIITSQRELCSCGLRSKCFWSSYRTNFADPLFLLSFHLHWRTRAEALGTLASVHVNLLVYFIQEFRFPKETLIF